MLRRFSLNVPCRSMASTYDCSVPGKDTLRRFRTSCAGLLLAVLALAPGCASSNWVTMRDAPKNPLAASLNLFHCSGVSSVAVESTPSTSRTRSALVSRSS